MVKHFVQIVIVLIVLFSCQKPEERACWKSVGEETALEIALPYFNKIELYEHLEYVLVQDSVEKIVIIGGKNLVTFVKSEVKDELLILTNENKCAFLRSYKKKLKVEIHFTDLINIHFEGTESLTNLGMLELNWMTLLIRDGAGSVKLNFNANSIHATITHGWGDFIFTGTVAKANLNIRSNGYCDTYGMVVTDSLTVISNTQGTTKVNANATKFKSQIDADGDILFKGIPISVKLNRYGAGELIDAN